MLTPSRSPKNRPSCNRRFVFCSRKPTTCVQHRAGITPAKKAALLQQLLTAGLVDPNDDATFPGGLLAGVFPPILNEGSACPQLPQAFYSAPGSVFAGHHSYPGENA